MTRTNTAIWGISLLLEPSPGCSIHRAAAEAVEFANTMCYYETSRVAMAFNSCLLRLHKDSTADSVVQDYYDWLGRAAKSHD